MIDLTRFAKFCFIGFSELLKGLLSLLLDTQSGIYEKVLDGRIDFKSNRWPRISDSAKDLIKKMLCPYPLERLKAHEVLS